ncbi:unnamed protein product, partial [Rotaria sordida]
ITMETLGIVFLGTLLREYANKYEHPREKLIVLVHWTFLSKDFLISKDGEDKDLMDWIKNENNSFDIDYFRDDIVIQTEQFFDNENFYIRFKMNENDQLIQMSVNDYINENDGCLKNISEFIEEIACEIYDFSDQNDEILKKIKKRLKELEEQEKAILVNEQKNDNQPEIS